MSFILKITSDTVILPVVGEAVVVAVADGHHRIFGEFQAEA
jgi:hypothetical protein